MRGMASAAADVLTLAEGLLGRGVPLHVRAWDGSEAGPAHAKASIHVRSPLALRRLLWAPGELGLGRAYVAGDVDVEGSIFDLLALRDHVTEPGADLRLRGRALDRVRLARVAARNRTIGRPPAPPPEEVRLRGSRHSPRRDRDAISHHYDVGNEFYELVLGPTLTYSCAYFVDAGSTLEEAQAPKHELVCSKLGLAPGMRLLDVGCGWGSLAMHAARHHGARVVGVTISREQAELARRRVADAGLADAVEIRVSDYREVDDGPFDAISSIGMFEHVGLARTSEYLRRLHGLVRPGGRVLNHAISRPDASSSAFDRESFVERYVFPDGELLEVGTVVTAAQARGLEARDVESLREHYARTLRSWVANLERGWDRAVALVGEGRARVWRLYMAGSALGFEAGRLNIHQLLAVRPHDDGRSGMPPTRDGFAVRPVELRASATVVRPASSGSRPAPER